MKNRGRWVGLLYLLVSVPGFFALAYVPKKVIAHGDPAVTAHNLVAMEGLWRAGIALNVVSEILFVGVAVALYWLFRDVNRRWGLAMVGLIAAGLPIVLVNELNAIAALMLATGSDFLGVVGQAQRESLAMMFVNLQGSGYDLCGFFWGLWLFPLGMLVWRSALMPRFLAVLLMLNCVEYVVESFMTLLAPQYDHIVALWMKPLSFGELAFMLWLLVMGVKAKPVVVAAS
jgi:hypothetical protein